MNTKRVGIYIAKQVFQVHGVDYQDKVVLRKQLRRNQMLSFFATLSLCMIGMEACGGAHYWARELQKLGHTVKLMGPQFVKPYVKSNKNDANDEGSRYFCERFFRASCSKNQQKLRDRQCLRLPRFVTSFRPNKGSKHRSTMIFAVS